MKSYVKAILGKEDLSKFNDFETGVIYMERSRLDQPLPERQEFAAALEFAENTMEGAKECSSISTIAIQVGKLSIELLELQLKVLDSYPEETDWTYRKSMELTASDPNLCDQLDFVANKIYQLMPEYTKVIEMEQLKDFMRN